MEEWKRRSRAPWTTSGSRSTSFPSIGSAQFVRVLPRFCNRPHPFCRRLCLGP
jgi:hypothetical protein